MSFIISYAFVLMASFFNAIMDATENENFGESIFKKMPKQFWYKRDSWKYAPKLFSYKFDAWHIAKSGMIICFAGAIIFFRMSHQWWVHFISIGIIWNAGFWFFYHICFKVK